MRKELESTLESVKRRVFHNEKKADDYMTELAMVISCTAGPLVIAAFIEHGLQVHRETKKASKKKRKN
jgi:hypothetical protein